MGHTSRETVGRWYQLFLQANHSSHTIKFEAKVQAPVEIKPSHPLRTANSTEISAKEYRKDQKHCCCLHELSNAQLGLVIRTSMSAPEDQWLSPGGNRMVLADFSPQDKLGRVRFLEETFLLADTSMEVVLRMPFPSPLRCGHMVCRERAWLKKLHNAKAMPLGRDQEG